MVGSRTLTAVVGLLASVLVTIVLWQVFDTLAVFLLVPFVPFLFRGGGNDQPDRQPRTCPECGFRTQQTEYDYCPRDGRRLERRAR